MKSKYIKPIDFGAFKINVNERKKDMNSMLEEFEMLKKDQREMSTQKQECIAKLAQANIKYKDTILKEVIRIQRWFRHIRSKFIFKFILNKAKDKHKARLR